MNLQMRQQRTQHRAWFRVKSLFNPNPRLDRLFFYFQVTLLFILIGILSSSLSFAAPSLSKQPIPSQLLPLPIPSSLQTPFPSVIPSIRSAYLNDPLELPPSSAYLLTRALSEALKQSSEPKSSGFCKELPSILKIPEELQLILKLIAQPGSPETSLIRSQILALTTPLLEGPLSLDLSSQIFQEAKKKNLTFSKLEKPSWFAGGDAQNYRIPKTQDLEAFFSNLFLLIPKYSEPWNPTQLSRADLFHAHLIAHQRLKDLILIFHAKEYPRDHPSLCPSCLMRGLFDTFALHLPTSIQSHPPSELYVRRNYLISLRQKKLCGLNTTQDPFLKLAQDDGDGSTLDPVKSSDLKESGQIMNLHFFPGEGVPLFIDTLKEGEKK